MRTSKCAGEVWYQEASQRLTVYTVSGPIATVWPHNTLSTALPPLTHIISPLPLVWSLNADASPCPSRGLRARQKVQSWRMFPGEWR